MKKIGLIVALLAIVLTFGCGNLRGLQNGMYAAGYEYIFAADQPSGFTGDWQDDPEVLAIADELLVGRTIEFSPALLITTAPGWDSNTKLQRARVSSPIGHSGFNLLYWTAGWQDFYYSGNANVDDGKMTITLTQDVSGDAMPVQLEYVFDLSEAQALVDSMKGWRTQTHEGFAVSTDMIETDVTLSGSQEGESWVLECKQEIACIAIKWEAM